MDRANGEGWPFLGRIFLRGSVRAVTGLHVGGSAGALAIGNVDQPVVRNPMNGQPYLPGSSIRGKMRSLAEKFHGLPSKQRIGRDVYIHSCADNQSYAKCRVCQVFGVPGSVPGQSAFGGPTRLLVRDVALSEESARELQASQTDLPYTEIKWEAAIDRVTSAATPRQLERVPAGVVFAPLDLVYTVYRPGDLEYFGDVLQGLQWIEDDYLGGQGSRGSGKVQFEDLTVSIRTRASYIARESWNPGRALTRPAEILEGGKALYDWLGARLLAG